MKEYLLQAVADNIPVLLTGAFTILGAIGGGIISGQTTRKNDKQKLLHEKRTDLYSCFYEIVEKFWNDRSKLFERSYFEEIIAYKAKMKLLSSRDTYEAFKNYYEYIHVAIQQFEKYCNENNPYNDPDKFETIVEEDGEEITHCYVTELDEQLFEAQKRDFLTEHVPTADEVQKYIRPLYEAMRKDLGSK